MATLRRKKAEPFSVFQRDPGPWPPILLNWMATLAIIMVFGLVMLFSASYTTGYLRFGDSFHYIKSQLLCTVLGLGMMFLFSYFDHRFLRRMVKLGYVVCLILLVLVLFMLLIIRGYWIAMHARDRFGALMAAGLTTHLALQVFLNIGVVTNFLPATGISLPFFSYGGTALLIQLFEVGLILSISRQNDNKLL